MHRKLGAALAAVVALSGCGSPAPAAPAPRPTVDSPWVRTTDGAKDQTMTALFGEVANPTGADITLVSASCPVAGTTEIHEMAEVDGKKVMRKAAGGVTVPAGRHVHLKPGGYHVMLMRLGKPLPVGEEVSCTLTFSEGTTLEVKAPVKVFTEEEDHYHPGDPTPTAKPSS